MMLIQFLIFKLCIQCAEKEKKAYERIEQQEIRSLEEKWKVFKDKVLKCATEVCGCRQVEQASGGMIR